MSLRKLLNDRFSGSSHGNPAEDQCLDMTESLSTNRSRLSPWTIHGDQGATYAQQTEEAVAVEQIYCPLYSKLPTEIRQQIFELVVSSDGSVVHIFCQYPKVGCWRCKKQVDRKPCTWDDPCSKALSIYSKKDSGTATASWDYHYPYDKAAIQDSNMNWGVVAFLCTCRKM